MPKQTGLRPHASSVHINRTMMFRELDMLFVNLPPESGVTEYECAIVENNLLGKPTSYSRQVTARYLKTLYGLDPNIVVFRLLRALWDADTAARPLLAATCAVARDPLFAATFSVIKATDFGEPVVWEMLPEALPENARDRYSFATMRSFGQNAASSWQQSGHLRGKLRKHRSQANATPLNAAYALAVGYLQGWRGDQLLNTTWVHLLDCSSIEDVLELVVAASHHGWLEYRRVGDVSEIRVDALLLPEEMDLADEQN